MIDSNFEIDFVSDNKYENITVEISYKKQMLCQLNKDSGADKIEIEFFNDSRCFSKDVKHKFNLDNFMTILNSTKLDLINT
ncbi:MULTISPECIES: hypothetical protein [Proteus]|uniref:Uncharacterized protein n=1 Tax=Proteus columbae TaxID=1987580 RepID=A0A6I7D7K0_9GAMM|nr:hypothetical protein [Proteus columbae]MBG3020709.1 hypothetical protein [Proteus mirabilis]QHN09922.1 hypothetical protein F1325_05390 [Proteus columbae]